MQNLLTGGVHVTPAYGSIVWYEPAGFVGVLTDATVLDQDGELLLVTNGWRFKIISIGQVQRIQSTAAHIAQELADETRVQFEQESRFSVGRRA